MASRESETFTTSFNSIDKLIDEFRARIPPLSRSSTKAAGTRTLMLIHSLTNVATIKLHEIFSCSNLISNQKCVQAACDVVNFNGFYLRSLGVVNPVYGVRVPFPVICFTLTASMHRFFGTRPVKCSLMRSQGDRLPGFRC